MRKFLPAFLAVFMFLPVFSPVLAAVTVSVGPTSLVTSPVTITASSTPLGVFRVGLTADAGETLSSVNVLLTANGSSVVTGADFASVAIYRDNGNGTFESSIDTLAGSQSS